jgi:aromatic-L-amino-acid decarboxylase
MVAYTSEQAHSSIEKGARVTGFGNVRLVAVDERLAMRPDALRRMIDEDIEAGLIPAVVASAVGTTGTAAVDPIRSIGRLAREYGLWHHVDAAYAGSAMICPEFRPAQDGLELADSYTFNPHKWMLVGVDCSMFYVADRSPLIDAMSIVPPFLRNEASESGEVIDYRDWHVALGRRFRALKVWFVLRSYGAAGIRAMIREHIRLAEDLAHRLEADDRFELVVPVSFALACFRHVGGDDATDELAAAINSSGHSYLTASKLDDRSFIRVSVGQTQTRQLHVDRLWELIDRTAPPAGG